MSILVPISKIVRGLGFGKRRARRLASATGSEALVCPKWKCRIRTGKLSISNLLTATNSDLERKVRPDLREPIFMPELERTVSGRTLPDSVIARSVPCDRWADSQSLKKTGREEWRVVGEVAYRANGKSLTSVAPLQSSNREGATAR